MGKGKKRWRGYEPYCERTTALGIFPGKPGLYICRECNFCMKKRTIGCPNCAKKGSIVFAGYLARPPRKNASKAEWRKFWEMLDAGKFMHPDSCR
ncbi:MAG: hypothetical protein R3321_05175 [Nitrososphaeraceae archaeon]|nr:hypothetical protein [Nitrososphaeraceae archaeon]